jgi:hypothetical protein
VSGSCRVFIELSEKRIGQKFAFFKELGMARKDLGRFLLSNAWIFYLDFSRIQPALRVIQGLKLI